MLDRIKWALLFAVPLALLLALQVATPGRGAIDNREISPPLERKFSGTVEQVKEHTCEVCNAVELAVLLKSNGERLEVRLGPKWFFEKHSFSVSRGDSLEITGIRFWERGKDLFLAHEVRNGDKRLVLRAKDGEPVWFAEHGHVCPVCGN